MAAALGNARISRIVAPSDRQRRSRSSVTSGFWVIRDATVIRPDRYVYATGPVSDITRAAVSMLGGGRRACRREFNWFVEDADLVARAGTLCDTLLRAALGGTTRAERRRSRRLGRILGDAAGRALLFTLTDEVLRVSDDARAARRLRSLVASGVSRSLGPLDRAGLRVLARVGRSHRHRWHGSCVHV